MADNHSVAQAVKWIDAVEWQLQDLVLNPERYGYAPENGLFAYPLHQMLVGTGKPCLKHATVLRRPEPLER